ncbi:MAG TPA: type II toxin-antitoxin system VapC family toxin [Candidatus Limnocylindrales bacterium]|nr:type II toxin-antitoxin system VapC family toxin [Candidatus Limnocylindrales bacterium]
MPAVLDTHAAIWYLLDSTKLSQPVFSLIDAAAASGTPTYISAVSLVEIVYLVERGRIAAQAFDKLTAELESDNPTFRVVALDAQVAATVKRVPRSVVPDMPDRIIAATALHFALPLVTRDRRLQSVGIQTIW